MLEGDAKQAMEALTIELCGKLLPTDKAAATLEKLQKKRDTTWGKVRGMRACSRCRSLVCTALGSTHGSCALYGQVIVQEKCACRLGIA